MNGGREKGKRKTWSMREKEVEIVEEETQKKGNKRGGGGLIKKQGNNKM